jgi:hypothetical protein
MGTFCFFLMRANCSDIHILLHLIPLIVFGKRHKSHYTILSSPHYSHLGPNILLSTLFSNSLKLTRLQGYVRK